MTYRPLLLAWLVLAIQAAAEPTAWIPLNQLPPARRALVEPVTRDVTLQREYPARQFTGELRHFVFLMDHMAITATIAEHVGLIRYRVTRDDQGRYWADNREGAQGYLLPVWRADGVRIFYVEGSRRGVFEARGRGVAAVQYRQAQPSQIEFRGAAFVKVDNRFLELLAELFRIFLKGTVDEQFEHILRQPIRLTEWAGKDPQGLQQALADLAVDDRQRVAPFIEMLGPTAGNPFPGE